MMESPHEIDMHNGFFADDAELRPGHATVMRIVFQQAVSEFLGNVIGALLLYVVGATADV
jgi:hypothetical protein